MNSRTNANFWKCFDALPREVQSLAREKYQLWKRDPFHPSLQFKLVGDDLWSVRVNLQYRALARRRGDLIVWFWIGTHQEYNRMLA